MNISVIFSIGIMLVGYLGIVRSRDRLRALEPHELKHEEEMLGWSGLLFFAFGLSLFFLSVIFGEPS